jgi:LmbE family N-acetylglucosaminyl deacetylase
VSGPRFDHRDTGTPEQRWVDDGRLAELPVLPMPAPGDHLLVVAAHPDDESLGAGGLIHQAGRCGARVSVVVATDGEGSHPASTSHPPGVLAGRRRAEALAAAAELGDHVTVHALALPDGGLDTAEEALATALAEVGAAADLVVTPWVGDRHPDHAAAARAGAQLAARLGVPHLAYPVWMWHWADPDHPEVPWGHLRALPLSSADLAAKARAVRAHRSQTEPLSAAPGDEAVLPASTLAHFTRRTEPFVVTEPAPAARPGYFDALYAHDDDDPWGLGTRFYERRKRATLVAALPRPRFRRAFEPGCATGLLTVELAARCDEVVAYDVAGAAVERTTSRLRDHGLDRGVTVARGRVPADWPDGRFDLVVLSEVGYYARDLDELVAAVVGSLTEDGVVVGCHWRHPAADHPHTGDAVHAAFGRRLSASVTHVEEDFLLHVWGAGPAALESVARREGIVS